MKVGTAELVDADTKQAITKVSWSAREFTILAEAKACGSRLTVLSGPHRDFDSNTAKVFVVELPEAANDFTPEFFNSKKQSEWGYMRIHVKPLATASDAVVEESKLDKESAPPADDEPNHTAEEINNDDTNDPPENEDEEKIEVSEKVPGEVSGEAPDEASEKVSDATENIETQEGK